MSISADRAAPAASLQGLLLLFVAAGSWGLTYPVQKFLLTELPPFSARMACAALGVVSTFGIAALRRERLGLPARQAWRVFVASMLNFGFFSVMLVSALLWLTASEAVICTYTMPVWACLLAWLLFGERLSRARGAALALGLSGIVVLVGAAPAAATWDKWPGYALGLGGAWVFALGTVLARHWPPRMPPVAGVGWQIVLGSLPALVLALGERPDWAAVTPLGWGAVLYCASLPMVVAYLAWFRALTLLPAATASIGTLIAPVIGVTSSALLLGEPVGLRQVAALTLTLAGVGLAVRG